ncbi:hypothetical protein FUAX_23470 [Fulvitalea axinellae]|uniref:Uncharacterized protein n=1 Tax=Fulvitalea axinellae TaxID=1182444 RepID=A0AAU9DBZ0_9BACT|nr:hypothetical protein FUAX_23470 [Fulvitalea axinellae]
MRKLLFITFILMAFNLVSHSAPNLSEVSILIDHPYPYEVSTDYVVIDGDVFVVEITYDYSYPGHAVSKISILPQEMTAYYDYYYSIHNGSANDPVIVSGVSDGDVSHSFSDGNFTYPAIVIKYASNKKYVIHIGYHH